MTTISEYIAKTTKNVLNLDRFNAFINGVVGGTVTTDTGTYRNFPSIVQDLEVDISQADAAATRAETAAEAAEASLANKADKSALDAEVVTRESLLAGRNIAPLAVLKDAAGYAAVVVENDGHVLRNMKREPSRQVPVKPLMVVKDEAGYAAMVVEHDGSLIRRMTNEPARHISGVYARLEVDRLGYAISGSRLVGEDVMQIAQAPSGLTAEVNIIPLYGQSLSLGYESVPVVTPSAFSANALMFSGGVRTSDGGDTPTDFSTVVQLHESFDGTVLGETPASGAALGIISSITGMFGASLDDLGAKMLFHAGGQGNTEVANLSKGTAPYELVTRQMRYGVQYAHSAGLSVAAPFFINVQGEQDMAVATDPSVWQLRTMKLRQDIERDFFAASGEMRSVICAQMQTSSFALILPASGGNGLPIALAQAGLGDISPAVVVAGPSYMFDFISGAGHVGVHVDAKSSKLMGAYASRAYLQSLRLDVNGALVYSPERRFRPLAPIEARQQGTRVIDITFRVPKPPLVFDTSVVTDPGNYGFSIERDGTTVAITSVVIHGRNRVRITAAADLRRGDMIGYALHQTPPSSGGWQAGRIYGPRGCLADSETFMFDTGGVNRQMRNYCVHSLIPIIL